jgi:hypothetical protein
MSNTRQNIIDAAVVVFTDDLSANMETISDRAGVTRRTLHRIFSDRNSLLEACKQEMNNVCKEAMNTAYNTSSEPVKQLEQMLYAGIDCNYKYAFLNKLQQRVLPTLISEHDDPNDDDVKAKWHLLVIDLQRKHIISERLTPHWIFFLFDGMITVTIAALESGDVARNDIKKFAWYSFSKSIGIIPVKND